MLLALDHASVKQIEAALIAGVAEIERLAKLVDELQSRITEFEQLDVDISTYVERVVRLRSSNYADPPPYAGLRGLGFVLNQDYDELDELRAHVDNILQHSPRMDGQHEGSSSATVAVLHRIDRTDVDSTEFVIADHPGAISESEVRQTGAT